MILKQSFKYRDVWMGIAMLWVIWYHLPIEVSIPLSEVSKTWDMAVWIFFCLHQG